MVFNNEFNELDIITFDNNKKYVFAKSLLYNEKEYVLLIEVDDDENILDDQIIYERISLDNGFELRTINDELLYKIISEKFSKILLESVK